MKEHITKLECCPHCGSDEGFYEKMQVRGTIRCRHNFDGTEAENSDMYDYLNYAGGKYAYCLHCNKRLFKMPT